MALWNRRKTLAETEKICYHENVVPTPEFSIGKPHWIQIYECLDCGQKIQVPVKGTKVHK